MILQVKQCSRYSITAARMAEIFHLVTLRNLNDKWKNPERIAQVFKKTTHILLKKLLSVQCI